MTKIAGSASASESGPFVRGMDPRIRIRFRIHTKMSWIRNTGIYPVRILMDSGFYCSPYKAEFRFFPAAVLTTSWLSLLFTSEQP